MRLTHAALDGMLHRGHGRIINVASVAALPAALDIRGGARRWLISFSRWANGRYAPRGVTVTAVCPGFVHTNFHERLGLPPGQEGIPQFLWLNAPDVVREALRDVARGKAVSIPSLRYKAIVAATRFVPAGILAGAAPAGAEPRALPRRAPRLRLDTLPRAVGSRARCASSGPRRDISIAAPTTADNYVPPHAHWPRQFSQFHDLPRPPHAGARPSTDAHTRGRRSRRGDGRGGPLPRLLLRAGASMDDLRRALRRRATLIDFARACTSPSSIPRIRAAAAPWRRGGLSVCAADVPQVWVLEDDGRSPYGSEPKARAHRHPHCDVSGTATRHLGVRRRHGCSCARAAWLTPGTNRSSQHSSQHGEETVDVRRPTGGRHDSSCGGWWDRVRPNATAASSQSFDSDCTDWATRARKPSLIDGVGFVDFLLGR